MKSLSTPEGTLVFHADLNSLLVYAPASFAFSQAHFKIPFISSTVWSFVQT